MKSPYKGLQPLDAADSRILAGRERDIAAIVSSLTGSPLTILYGESGVGKTSIIRAGLVPELAKPERRVATIVFREWQGKNFEVKLRSAILQALLEAINRLRVWEDDKDVHEELSRRTRAGTTEPQKLPSTSTHENTSEHPKRPPLTLLELQQAFDKGLKTPLSNLSLDRFMKECCAAFYGRLFFIFDQFEEYFYYHPLGTGEQTFDVAFARAVNNSDISASFLLSLREDGLAKLDRLRGRIPGLFGNLIRLEHLDFQGAREAIYLPITKYREELAEQGDANDVGIDEDLVETLLGTEKKPGQVREDVLALNGEDEATSSLFTTEARPENGPASEGTPANIATIGVSTHGPKDSWRYRVLAIEAILHRLWEVEIDLPHPASPKTLSLCGLRRLASGGPTFQVEDFSNLAGLLKLLETSNDPLSRYLWLKLSSTDRSCLKNLKLPREERDVRWVNFLNRLFEAEPIYDEQRFANIQISHETRLFLEDSSKYAGSDLARVNRLLLIDAYPKFIWRSQLAGESEAKAVVRTYFDAKMRRLAAGKIDDAAEILRALVRPGEKKRAGNSKSLHRDTQLPIDRVETILNDLAGEELGILVTLPDTDPTKYELQHDVMAFALKDWCDRRRQIQRERIAVRQVEEEYSRERLQLELSGNQKLLQRMAVAALALAVSIGFLIYYAYQSSQATGRLSDAFSRAISVRDSEFALSISGGQYNPGNFNFQQIAALSSLSSLPSNVSLAPPKALVVLRFASRNAIREPNANDGKEVSLRYAALSNLKFPEEIAQKQQEEIGKYLPSVLSPNKKWLVTLERTGKDLELMPVVWNAEQMNQREFELPATSEEIAAIAFDEQTGEFIAERSSKKSLTVWNLETRSSRSEQFCPLESRKNINGQKVQRSPQGRFFSYTEVRDAWVWESLTALRPLSEKERDALPAAFIPFDPSPILAAFKLAESDVDKAATELRAALKFVGSEDSDARQAIAWRFLYEANQLAIDDDTRAQFLYARADDITNHLPSYQGNREIDNLRFFAAFSKGVNSARSADGVSSALDQAKTDFDRARNLDPKLWEESIKPWGISKGTEATAGDLVTAIQFFKFFGDGKRTADSGNIHLASDSFKKARVTNQGLWLENIKPWGLTGDPSPIDLADAVAFLTPFNDGIQAAGTGKADEALKEFSTAFSRNASRWKQTLKLLGLPEDSDPKALCSRYLGLTEQKKKAEASP